MFDLLLVLVQHPGRVLEKEFLLGAVWPDSFVEEGNITFNIRQLRKALGDDAQSPTYIETVPRRGYRFVAKVEESVIENGAGPAPQPVPVPAAQPEAVSPEARSRNWAPILIPVVSLVLLIAAAAGVWLFKGKAATAPILSTPFSAERISGNGRVYAAAISPDGKTVVYTDRLAGKYSVWLRQLEYSNNIQIIPPLDEAYFEFVFSPDGAFLYFTREKNGSDSHSDIYRVSIFGGVPAKVIGETQGWMSLSKDGGKLSFVRCYYEDAEYCSLWIADSDGKNERKLASRPRPFRIGDNEISPDGRKIAFAVGQSRNAGNEFQLAEIDIESGQERAVTAEKFFNIKHLAWLPDQSGLITTASRIPTKHFRIWEISIPGGQARPLTRDSETYSVLSIDRDANAVVTTQIKEDFRLWLYSMDRPTEKGAILAEGTRAAFSAEGRIFFSTSSSGNSEIWSMDVEGRDRRQLTSDPADDTTPVVSTDDNWIFFVSNRTGEAHIWKMNADGSGQTQVTFKEGGFPMFVSADGRWIYYHHAIHGSLWRANADGGGEEIVIEASREFFAASPNRQQVAYIERNGSGQEIVIASLPEGRVIHTFKTTDPADRVRFIEWKPDGKGLIYVTNDPATEKRKLWLQPLDSGEPKKLTDLGDEEISDIALGADGKHLIVVQGGWKHDAVLLRGLQ